MPKLNTSLGLVLIFKLNTILTSNLPPTSTPNIIRSISAKKWISLNSPKVLCSNNCASAYRVSSFGAKGTPFLSRPWLSRWTHSPRNSAVKQNGGVFGGIWNFASAQKIQYSSKSTFFRGNTSNNDKGDNLIKNKYCRLQGQMQISFTREVPGLGEQWTAQDGFWVLNLDERELHEELRCL